MDPPAVMSSGAFSSPNAAGFNLMEIWPFPIHGCGESSGGGLDLRTVQFGAGLGQLLSDNADRDDPMALDHTANHNGGGGRKRRDNEESGKGVSSKSNGRDANDCDGKRRKKLGSRDENRKSEAEAAGNSGKGDDQNAKPAEAPKQDYIHVRARRGQATDSHSLAERARREKISDRMKILQDLVPGCNKVIGKALVLDEIINYIQSLQRQVEFLSMKLEAVDSGMNSSIEGFPSKDFGQQTFDTASMAFGSQTPREYARSSSPEWLHMQLGGGFERTS